MIIIHVENSFFKIFISGFFFFFMYRKFKRTELIYWKAFVTLVTTIQKFGVSKNLF